jgi:hypothetical protein
MQKNAFDVVLSFLIWTSVFVMGILISVDVFRVFVAGGAAAYHLLRP